MKNISFLFLLFAAQVFSQTVALPDLIALQAKPHTAIKQHFVDAKWKLVDERYNEKRNFGDMTFSSTEKPDAATIRLTVFYGQDKTAQTRLQLKFKSREHFVAIKSSINDTDLKFAATEVNGNLTTTVFKNETLTVTILASKPVGGQSEYDITVQSNAYDPKMYNFSIGQ